jgi:beta-N-acetylhexosaminidase
MTTRSPWGEGQDDRSPDTPPRQPPNSQRPLDNLPRQARASRGPAPGGFAPPRLQPQQTPANSPAPLYPNIEDLPTQHMPASAADAPARTQAPDIEDLPTRRMSAAPAPSVSEIETQYLPGPARATRPPGASPRPTRPPLSAPPTRSSPLRPRWLTGLFLALALILIGVRAGFASTALILPGGEIPGWSKLPPTVCKICIPTVTGQKPLTQTEYATLLTNNMSLDDKLGQLMLVQFVGHTATPDAIRMINQQGAGGVLFFGLNIDSADQVKALTAQLRSVANVPLLIAVDQEGGPVNRFQSIVGALPSASSLTSPDQARARGSDDARYLHDFGFNLNLAPVVDVGVSNPELAGRTFGSDPSRVATYAGAYLDGLQQSNQVTATLKHFPGLGATFTDPHVGLPTLNRTRDDWDRIDLEPYRELLADHDVRAIMVSHEMIPAVDKDYPSSLSPATVTGVLRDELGFQGVIVTDSLYMGALNAHWSVPQAAVLAVLAGSDLIIGPDGPQTVQLTKDAFHQALDSGKLTQARIDQSVQRVLLMKIKMGVIPMPTSSQATETPSSATSTPLIQPSATPTR